jgi:hypothetical protein
MLQKKCSSVQKGGRNRRAANITVRDGYLWVFQGIGYQKLRETKTPNAFFCGAGGGGRELRKAFQSQKIIET